MASKMKHIVVFAAYQHAAVCLIAGQKVCFDSSINSQFTIYIFALIYIYIYIYIYMRWYLNPLQARKTSESNILCPLLRWSCFTRGPSGQTARISRFADVGTDWIADTSKRVGHDVLQPSEDATRPWLPRS